jgi:hypothetical protein
LHQVDAAARRIQLEDQQLGVFSLCEADASLQVFPHGWCKRPISVELQNLRRPIPRRSWHIEQAANPD